MSAQNRRPRGSSRKRRKGAGPEVDKNPCQTSDQVQLPGFYWDAVKKRYFKMQTNHDAQPNALYSASAIRHRERMEERIQKKKKTEERLKSRIKRLNNDGSVLDIRLPLKLVLREIGSTPYPDVRYSAYQEEASKLYGSSKSCGHVSQLLYPGQVNCKNSNALVFFSYDPSRNTFCALQQHEGCITTSLTLLHPKHPFQYKSTVSKSALQQNCLTLSGALLLHSQDRCYAGQSSLAIASHSGHTIVARPRSSTRLYIIPEKVDHQPDLPMNGQERHHHDGCALVKAECQALGNEDQDLHRLIIQPDPSVAWMTAGNLLAKYDLSSIRHWSDTSHVNLQPALDILEPVPKQDIAQMDSDILSMSFLSKNLLLVGTRKGHVRMYDTRLPKTHAHHVLLVKHAASVTNLASGPHATSYFIANGIPDKMCMYDIRQIGAKLRRHCSYSTPVVKYTTCNAAYPSLDLGFDSSAHLDLIAAAQDDSSIRLFSMSTGGVLQNLRAPSSNAWTCIFRQIQIVESHDTVGLYRILAARQTEIYDFASHYDAFLS